jgi:hypothetical protein
VRPDGWAAPVFEQWTDPMLQPFTHVLHAPASGVAGALEWCEAHPADCERMARNAHDYMACVIRGTAVTDDYLTRVMEYMHDAVFGSQAAVSDWCYSDKCQQQELRQRQEGMED